MRKKCHYLINLSYMYLGPTFLYWYAIYEWISWIFLYLWANCTVCKLRNFTLNIIEQKTLNCIFNSYFSQCYITFDAFDNFLLLLIMFDFCSPLFFTVFHYLWCILQLLTTFDPFDNLNFNYFSGTFSTDLRLCILFATF